MIEKVEKNSKLYSPEYMLKSHRSHEYQGLENFIDSKPKYSNKEQRKQAEYDLLLFNGYGSELQVAPNNEAVYEHRSFEVKLNDRSVKKHESPIDIHEHLVKCRVLGKESHDEINSNEEEDDRLRGVFGQLKLESESEGDVFEFFCMQV